MTTEIETRTPEGRFPKPVLSVVVLAYRSAATIESLVEQLRVSLEAHQPNWEIVLVGNFIEDSGDGTPEVVRRISDAHPRIRAITRVKHGMMGWDMKSGLEMASGNAIAVIDGDGQNPVEDVVRAHRKLVDEGLDLVKAYRVLRDDGRYRRIISTVYNFVFRVLFPGLGCRDLNSKPKVMTRAAYNRMALASNGWFIDAEIMIHARRLGLRIGEIPVHFRSLDHRPSFVRPGAIIEFTGNLLWFRWQEFRRRPDARRTRARRRQGCERSTAGDAEPEDLGPGRDA